MYNILVVDDELLICKGLAGLLGTSGLDIDHVFTAVSGYEALDYLKMENIDLLITDIQMNAMSGLELMQQAKLIKPWVQAIVISAHETFQYAQIAMRLGARDYIIKPIDSVQLLDSVRHVLLHMDRPVQEQEELISSLRSHFKMDEPMPKQMEVLNQIISACGNDCEMAISLGKQKFGISLHGPYFALIKIRMDYSSGGTGKPIEGKDAGLIQYAALNIACELLDKEWDYYAFYSSTRDISIIIQWNEEQYGGESSAVKAGQLEMIGRSLHFNIQKFLGFPCVIGVSMILKGQEFLHELNNQVDKAISWSKQMKDHFVFAYSDFIWGQHMENPTEADLDEQNNLIVERAYAYIQENYTQKGLTLNEVAQKNHVSPNYLSYLFKKYKGINLWDYVIKLRMEESRRLILHTDLRNYEIAERVGYGSPEHFSKIFKKYFGVSPSEIK